MKAETERVKAPVDSTSLQLHNLMYEKSHYLKAIKACKDFKSKYPDIQLVTEAEFFSQAPEEFKGIAISNETAHNVMLKRLNYELFQVILIFVSMLSQSCVHSVVVIYLSSDLLIMCSRKYLLQTCY